VTDTINFIADDGVQRPWAALDDDAESARLFDGEALPEQGKCLFQIERLTAVGAESPNRVPAFFNDLSHQLLDMSEGRSGWRILCQIIHHDVELHGRADDALQQGVVQFLCDAQPLRQPLLEA
jgi:hypothetical protein